MATDSNTNGRRVAPKVSSHGPPSLDAEHERHEPSQTPQQSQSSETSQQAQSRFLAIRKYLPLAFAWRIIQRVTSISDAKRAPAFLVSLIVHTAIILLLALVVNRSARLSLFGSSEFVVLSVNESEEVETLEILATGDTPPPPNTQPEEQVVISQASTRAATENLVELLQIEAPPPAETASQGAMDRLMNASQLTVTAGFSSTGVEGRTPEQRRKLALSRGGTIKSEKAVEDALKWLAAHQQTNGAWSLVHSGGKCNGQCKNDGSKERFDTAATGLALLAFLGAGYTHVEGEYRQEVRKGVYFLLQVMEETPQGGSFLYQSERGMYNHGIATFALCEAYQLTEDPDLLKAAQKAVDFTVSAQHYHGGWGYLPKQPGDLTLSGWQTMALKSAVAAGLDVPSDTILRIDAFLDSQLSDSGVFYGYGKPGKNPTCTAIGLLIRLFRGTTHSDPNILEGAGYFQKVGRSNSDVYFNYYVTLFLHHVGGPFWEHWNPRIRDHLVNTQAKYGHEAGSWYFDNPFGKEGGRLYTTAMAAMTLEVYYRFSPLYQQTEETFKP